MNATALAAPGVATSSPSTSRPTRPTPPDCRRYWALWQKEEEEEGDTSFLHEDDNANDVVDVDGPIVERRPPQRKYLDQASIDRWNGELELTRYNQSVRKRADVLFRKLDAHLLSEMGRRSIGFRRQTALGIVLLRWKTRRESHHPKSRRVTSHQQRQGPAHTQLKLGDEG